MISVACAGLATLGERPGIMIADLGIVGRCLPGLIEQAAWPQPCHLGVSTASRACRQSRAAWAIIRRPAAHGQELSLCRLFGRKARLGYSGLLLVWRYRQELLAYNAASSSCPVWMYCVDSAKRTSLSSGWPASQSFRTARACGFWPARDSAVERLRTARALGWSSYWARYDFAASAYCFSAKRRSPSSACASAGPMRSLNEAAKARAAAMPSARPLDVGPCPPGIEHVWRDSRGGIEFICSFFQLAGLAQGLS